MLIPSSLLSCFEKWRDANLVATLESTLELELLFENFEKLEFLFENH